MEAASRVGDCLYPRAISARGAETQPVEDGKAFAVSLWQGGSCIEVKREVPAKSGAARASLHRNRGLSAFGDRLKRPPVEEAETVDAASEDRAASKRGKIAGFSRKARRRLLTAMHRLEKDAPCLFVTLTLPDSVAHDGRSLKAWKRAWWLRVTRRFPRAAAVWRLEVKRRKSGAYEGLPVAHLHLLLYGIPPQPGLHLFVHDAWCAVVGASARTQVQVPRSYNAVQAYASKLYAGKEEDDVTIEGVGRYWGFVNESFIPWAVEVIVKLTLREGIKLLRALRGYVTAQWRAKGKRRARRLTQWRSFFVDDPDAWLLQIGGIVG